MDSSASREKTLVIGRAADQLRLLLAALLALESHPTLPSFAELPAAATPAAAEPPAAPPAAPAGRPTLNPALQRARNASAQRRLPPVRPPVSRPPPKGIA